jgi:hypothetical protein
MTRYTASTQRLYNDDVQLCAVKTCVPWPGATLWQ